MINSRLGSHGCVESHKKITCECLARFAWLKARRGPVVYAAILSLIVLAAGARLALFPPQATLVRVAGLAIVQSRSRRSAAAADVLLPEPRPLS
jgi:hypothetical protein